jgi:hypothetical protein
VPEFDDAEAEGEKDLFLALLHLQYRLAVDFLREIPFHEHAFKREVAVDYLQQILLVLVAQVFHVELRDPSQLLPQANCLQFRQHDPASTAQHASQGQQDQVEQATACLLVDVDVAGEDKPEGSD